MPINVYTGLMRSGKSYEVVSQVILEAVAQGRRVVTNVDGINGELIKAHVAKARRLDIQKLGDVVHCTNEQVFQADFLPYYDNTKNAITTTFCQPGDLVCIDEAWRFWGTDCKLLAEHKSFFLEHGHFVHPVSKVACDLVLMIQDMGTLHRFVRNVVAFSFRTHKKVSLGLGNTYSVNMWEGAKMTKATLIGTWVRRYEKAIFPLYSSFKGGEQGKTVNVDKRQNILANKRLWIIGALTIGVGFAGVYVLIDFFSGSRFKKDAQPVAHNVAGSGTGARQTGPTTAQPVQATPQVSNTSEAWRLVGTVQAGQRAFVVITDKDGHTRLEHPSMFQGQGALMVGEVEGQRVATWTGAMAKSGSKP